ncbi:MAG: serine/threonine-protein phosphatase [Planctomycetaceae bacterium]|nr:serine/threonine-protein phosphatase [Planctomycetaceae bacterium]
MHSIRTGHLSITGNFRDNNEDNYVVDTDQRYFIVADGMGGQNAGEKASEMAVELIPKQLERLMNFDGGSGDEARKAIDESVAFANSEIMAYSEVDPSVRNMGTTVVFLVRCGKRFLVGGIGDSRVYQLRDGKLTQLTRDHSLTQALLDAGTINAEEAKTHRYRNVLYRYLGTKDGSSGTNACEVEPKSGDRFFLCSDGVTDGINNDQIQTLLMASDDPQEIASMLVEAAQKGGSRDNITGIVVLVD